MENSRKSPRASWIPYNEGIYFVTICTHEKVHYFGEIVNGEMQLSDIGHIAKSELENPHLHHPHIDVPQYVVMPNHVHMIVIVHSCIAHIQLPESAEDRAIKGYKENVILIPDGGRNVPLLSTYVRSFKAAVTKRARISNQSFSWQSRYHDHMIRGFQDLNRINDYIVNNVVRWGTDCYY